MKPAEQRHDVDGAGGRGEIVGGSTAGRPGARPHHAKASAHQLDQRPAGFGLLGDKLASPRLHFGGGRRRIAEILQRHLHALDFGPSSHKGGRWCLAGLQHHLDRLGRLHGADMALDVLPSALGELGVVTAALLSMVAELANGARCQRRAVVGVLHEIAKLLSNQFRDVDVGHVVE